MTVRRHLGAFLFAVIITLLVAALQLRGWVQDRINDKRNP